MREQTEACEGEGAEQHCSTQIPEYQQAEYHGLPNRVPWATQQITLSRVSLALRQSIIDSQAEYHRLPGRVSLALR